MKEVNVNINGADASTYPIFIEEKLIETADEYLKKYCNASKYLIITNEKINSLWGEKLKVQNSEKFIIKDKTYV